MRLFLSSKDKRKKSYGLLGEGTNCLKIYIRIKLAIRLLIYNTGKQKDIERLPREKKAILQSYIQSRYFSLVWAKEKYLRIHKN